MGKKFVSRNSTASKEYFVEVIGPDGVIHHIGPFEQLAGAKDWIAQYERAEATAPRRKQSA